MCADCENVLFGFSSVNLMKARRRRRINLSPSDAEVTNEYTCTFYYDTCRRAVHTEDFVFTFSHRIMFMIKVLSAVYGIGIEGTCSGAVTGHLRLNYQQRQTFSKRFLVSKIRVCNYFSE